jgi:fructuronate reductase
MKEFRREVDDPMAEQLASLWESEGREGIARALYGAGGLFAGYWQATEEDLHSIDTGLGIHS